MKTTRTTVLVICFGLLINGGAVGQNPPTPSQELQSFSTPGPYRVKVIGQITLDDPATGGAMDVRVYFPVTSGKCPVIIFSHGLGGNNNNFSALNTLLAGDGFVILAPNHPDAYILVSMRANHQVSADATEQDPGVIAQVYAAAKQKLGGKDPMQVRCAQIRELVDDLPQFQIDGFAGTLDTSRIGMAGHSSGAFTTELVAGILSGPQTQNWIIPQIAAAEVISGSGDRPAQGMYIQSQRTELPVLSITGSNDLPEPNGPEDYHWREDAFTKGPPGEEYLLFIQGATHTSYMGNPQAIPPQDRPAGMTDQTIRDIGTYTDAASAAFFLAYLQDDPAAKAFLASNAMGKATNNVATIEHR
jgi:predicted dienelactone hydrolase